MFLSKIWILLLSFISVLTLGAILVNTRPTEYFLTQSYKGPGMVVDLSQIAIDYEMDKESRQTIDRLSYIRLDSRLIEAIKDPKKSEKLVPVIKSFKEKLRVSELILSDDKGNVIVSTFSKRRSIAGFNGFKKAIKGFHSDNTLFLNKVLNQEFSVPVLSKDHKKVAGVLLAFRKYDGEYLKSLLDLIGHGNHKKFRIGIGVFINGKLAHSTFKHDVFKKVAPLYKKHSKDIRDPQKGYSATETVESKGRDYQVILGRIQGSVTNPLLEKHKKLPVLKDDKVFYAVVWKLPKERGGFAFMDKLIPNDQLYKGFPWILFVFLSIFLIVVGMFLVYFEGDMPVKKMIKQCKQYCEGELALINDQEFGGKYSRLAISFNEALETAQKNASPDAAVQSQTVDQLMSAQAASAGPGAMLPSGATPPPPLTGKPLNYPGSKKLNFENKRSSRPDLPPVPTSSRPDLPPVPSSSRPDLPPIPTSSKPDIPVVKSDSIEPPKEGEDSSLYFDKILKDFRALKEKLNENLDDFKDADFIVKLEKSTNTIREKTKCEQVNLEVYERDGKAGLKAFPKR
jgi:hypothetical protein